MSRKKINGERRREIVEALMERSGNHCWYCQKPMRLDCWDRNHDRLSLEHLIDKKYGGPNKKENLVLAHIKCNAAVDKMLFCEKLGYRNSFLKAE